MFNKKMKLLKTATCLFITSIVTSTFSLPLISCSRGGLTLEQQLKELSTPWYNSLTKAPFKPAEGNFHDMTCSSETQGIALYANYRGWFWNEYLNRNEIPPNYEGDLYGNGQIFSIKGSDYSYCASGLEKSIFPIDCQVYHGVEYLETEYWEQLKDYAVDLGNNSWDFSKAIGKQIECYGFFSTSLDKVEAAQYCDGWNWNDDKFQLLPLKQEAIFVIDIPKGYKGAAYLSDFDFSGTKNNDNQVLINKNCKFLIKDIKKENLFVGVTNSDLKQVNVFYLDLVGNNEV